MATLKEWQKTVKLLRTMTEDEKKTALFAAGESKDEPVVRRRRRRVKKDVETVVRAPRAKKAKAKVEEPLADEKAE